MLQLASGIFSIVPILLSVFPLHMKPVTNLLIALLWLAPMCVEAAPGAIKEPSVDSVEIWDQRVSDLHAKPMKIADSIRATALLGMIRSAPGKWKPGTFTAPSGDLRIVFTKDASVVEVYGVGHGFLVRGGGGKWESKAIDQQFETMLRALNEKHAPDR